MKTNWINIALAAALAAAASPLAAQTDGGIGGQLPTPEEPPNRQGTRGANFLEIGIGARANAMAGAVGSFIEGGTAWYWNPAGIASSTGFNISATRQNLYTDLDISQNFLGAGIPLLGGIIGASVNTLSSGDIPRTTEENPYGSPQFGETFEWTSTAIGVGYARRLTDRLDVGLQLKYISEGIQDARLSWIGADFGTQFRTGIYGLIVGASLQNVGPSATASGDAIERVVDTDEFLNRSQRVDFSMRETELPTAYRFSVGSDLYGRVGSLLGQGNGQNTLIGEVQVSDAIDASVQTAIGLEYGFRNIVFLRAGKRFYNDDRQTGNDNESMYGFSGGLGARLPVAGRSLRFDYAYTSLGDLENIQVFTFEFGR